MLRFLFLLLCFTFADVCSIEEAEWKKAFLVTYPRSGNHWVRYLLEEVTGIATSSVNVDRYPQHSTEIYPFGGYLPQGGYEGNRKEPTLDDIVVLKSHYPIVQSGQLPKGLIVRIVRHPIDSFYSLIVLECKKNNRKVPKNVPDQMVVNLVTGWKMFQNYWNKQKDILTLRYEDLLEFPKHNLEQIVSFMGINAKKEDLQRAVLRYPPNGNKVLLHLDKFTSSQQDYVRHHLSREMAEFGYTIP